ncbi:MAG TPA: NfeD family protein [Longimicrobium sp.]|nr:NfeD family protein [Longimicrobium sp.]
MTRKQRIGLGMAAALLAALAPAAASAQRGAGAVHRIPITREITPGLVPFVERALGEAEKSGAAAVVLDLDTPGGLVDSAEQIADAVGDAKVPVYAFVNRRALSAGALIALATDGIFMRPGSALGAATPVDGTGAKLPEKYVSAIRSQFRSLAEARGLNPLVAEAMVDEDVEIPGLDAKGKLLTLTTAQAVRVGYAREVADWTAMQAAAGAPTATVVTPEPNWAERLVRFLSSPLIAPFLLSFGFLGLIIELKTPHFGLAGLAGLGSLALFFGSHLIVGLAGWETLVLVAVGMILLLVEVFILPGFGVAGTLGLLSLSTGIVLTLLGSMPTTDDVAKALAVLVSAILLSGLALWALIQQLPQDRRGRHLLLSTAVDRASGFQASARRTELEGAEGVALTDLRPSGTARIGDEKLDVVSEGSFVAAGTSVRVVRSEGYRHIVRPV